MDVPGIVGVGPKFENRAADDRRLGFAADLVVDQELRADGEIAHAGIEHRHRRRRRLNKVLEGPRRQV
jgi:hypothetical protein